MKLKSYLRGLGLGMIVTTVILVLAFRAKNTEMSDEEIIARAYELGMVETSMYGSDENTDDNHEEQEKKDEQQTNGPEASNEGMIELETLPGMDVTTMENESSNQDGENNTEETTKEISKETTSAPEIQTTEPVSEPASEKETQSMENNTQSQEVITLVFENITSADKASRILYDAGIILSIEEFNAYLSENGLAGKINEGEFQFTKGMTFEEVAGIITKKR